MRLHRALAAAALTFGLVAAGTPSAQADPVNPPIDYSACQFTNGVLSNPVLVVGNTHIRSVQAWVRGSNCGTFDGDDAASSNAQGDFLFLTFGGDSTGYRNMPASFLRSSDTDPASYYGEPEANPDELTNDVAGKKLPGTIHLPDGTTRPFPGASIVLKRKVVLDDASTPSKTVKRNKSFYFGSHIDRADWNERQYTAYGKKEVRIQRLNEDDGAWDTIKKVKSRALKYEGGEVVGKIKLGHSACLRLVSDETSTSARGVSDTICVKVKK